MLVLGIESSCDETSLAFLENRESGQILATKDLASYLNSFHLLAQVVLSQIKLHAEYGGVIPELGARQHAEQIHFLFAQTLSQAASKRAELWPMEGRENEGQKEQGEENGKDLLEKGLEIEILRDLDYIFVTSEPGLVSALRVGMEFAKTIQFFTDIYWQKQVKIQHINHLRGHVASCFRV